MQIQHHGVGFGTKGTIRGLGSLGIRERVATIELKSDSSMGTLSGITVASESASD